MKRDRLIGAMLLVVALSAISGLALITVFIFREGVPIILRVGAGQFFLSTDWEPSLGHFGILSMLGGSLAVTVGAAVIGVVFSLGLAIVLTQFAPPGLAAALKPAIELLAGIPSVVYGVFGVLAIVPGVARLAREDHQLDHRGQGEGQEGGAGGGSGRDRADGAGDRAAHGADRARACAHADDVRVFRQARRLRPPGAG